MPRLTALLLALLLLALCTCQADLEPLNLRHRACVDGDPGADDLTEEEMDRELARLEEAYEDDSQEKLTAFLEIWAATIQPTSCDTFDALTDEVQEAYLVYHDYYDPFDLARYGHHFEPYAGYEYVVTVAAMEVKVEGGGWGGHADFRPGLDIPEAAVLYLSPMYQQILEAYLDENQDWDVSYDKYEFLDQQMPITPGHWGGWNILTPPGVSSVRFEADMNEAAVGFWLHSEGGTAYMVRDWWSWLLVQSDYWWEE
jgi:hypothetical protein